MKLKSLFRYLPHIPKSICFNLRVFDFKTALRLPVLVGRKVKIKSAHKGCIVLPVSVSPFSIKLGVTRMGGKSRKTHSYIMIEKGGKVAFGGETNICHGFSFIIGEKGTLRLGGDFFANDDFYCVCEKGITIGDGAHIGWNTSYRDHDGHDILENGVLCNPPAEINIGSHVWICTDVSVLKGVTIPNDTVVAQGSLVTKSFDERGTIIAGSPAKVIKRNIVWRI